MKKESNDKERKEAFNIEVELLKCVCKNPCVYWDDCGTLRCNDCGEDV